MHTHMYHLRSTYVVPYFGGVTVVVEVAVVDVVIVVEENFIKRSLEPSASVTFSHCSGLLN